MAADTSRRLQFRLRAIGHPASRRVHEIVCQHRLGAQLDPLALLGVRRGRRARLGFPFLSFQSDGRGAGLSFQVRRPALDRVQFGALLVAQLIDEGKFGHSAAFARLPITKITEPFLSRGHGIILAQEVTDDPPSQKDQA